jgi:hypothetical protein
MNFLQDNSTRILPHVDPRSLNYIIYHKNCRKYEPILLYEYNNFLTSISILADGFGAAYSAWSQLGTNVTYYAAEHGMPPPPDTEIRGKRIGIFDFSYKKSIINEIEEKAELVVVVDHHISAKQDLIGHGDAKERNYHFDMDKSGARLAWEFFNPEQKVPLLIRYVEDQVRREKKFWLCSRLILVNNILILGFVEICIA